MTSDHDDYEGIQQTYWGQVTTIIYGDIDPSAIRVIQGTDFCPGEVIANVTTHDQVNCTDQPVLIHLGKDPGEKYPIK